MRFLVSALVAAMVAVWLASSAGGAPEPDCATESVTFDTKLTDAHIRCTLMIDAHRTLEVSSDPVWTMTLREDGNTVQTFTEPTDQIGETGVVPVLANVDGEEPPELLVVTGRGGTGGEPMAVWKLSDAGRFVRAGEIFGFRHFYRSTDGFFGNYAHASAASGGVTLYRWVDDKLVTVVNLQTKVAELYPSPTDGLNWIHNGNVQCTVDTINDEYPPGRLAAQTAALQAVGLDPASAAEHFCTQPWVSTIYR